jgi:hypothetical protein
VSDLAPLFLQHKLLSHPISEKWNKSVNHMCQNNYIFVNKSDTIRESPCIYVLSVWIRIHKQISLFDYHRLLPFCIAYCFGCIGSIKDNLSSPEPRNKFSGCDHDATASSFIRKFSTFLHAIKNVNFQFQELRRGSLKWVDTNTDDTSNFLIKMCIDNTVSPE